MCRIRQLASPDYVVVANNPAKYNQTQREYLFNPHISGIKHLNISSGMVFSVERRREVVLSNDASRSLRLGYSSKEEIIEEVKKRKRML